MNIVYIDYVIVFVMLPAIVIAVSMSSWISRSMSFEREVYDWISPDLYIVPLVLASIVCVLVSAGTLYEIIVTTLAGTKSSAESKVGRLLLCFSAYTNTKKVFDTRQLPGQLPFLDGLRVLSALWIILGHMDFYGNVIASIGNRSEHDVRDQEWWFFIIEPYDLAVDTFLVLGGFLVSHVFLKQLKKRDGHFTGKDLALNYLHRYCRLTPVYLATLLIYLPFDKGCRSYWWTNLLYINNYFMEPEQQCTGSSWYLGVDMQLYIMAPALILLLYKKPKYGIFINVFLVVLSWACNQDPLNTVGIQLGCVNPFFWTPARMGPYVIGILLAYLLFRISSKIPNIRRTKVWMLVGWAINAALTLV
ncbi:PREDICTED: nose resistant to fluoxetine protein 6-like [Branchiostoma belcheri]|uniref:Nose resistant to fluoxetine protein 6-like n=1 Tax=Branchiostoma belcheri TaxID=7741 RepID=A0A6P4YGJ7_BRABE|nr:PREDICTED: nose resistant to fluoxetine protein 6-like [Branchiostoma belcheri]